MELLRQITQGAGGCITTFDLFPVFVADLFVWEVVLCDWLVSMERIGLVFVVDMSMWEGIV